MRVVSFSNQKGGVGKTSLVFHLGGAFASRFGLRVLLVDYDPQGSLTQGHLGPDRAAALPRGGTAAAIAGGEQPPLDGDILVPGQADLVPSHPSLDEFNLASPADCDPFDQLRLRDFVAQAEGKYDLVLIDCPPNLQLLTWQALMASTHLVVPAQVEDFGVQGLRPVFENVARVRAGDNPGLAIAGIALNMVEARRSGHQFYEENLRRRYPGVVLEARVPRRAAYSDAVAERLPITGYDPKSNAAEAMVALAEELLARLDRGGA